jgi:hypothetical protein
MEVAEVKVGLLGDHKKTNQSDRAKEFVCLGESEEVARRLKKYITISFIICAYSTHEEK